MKLASCECVQLASRAQRRDVTFVVDVSVAIHVDLADHLLDLVVGHRRPQRLHHLRHNRTTTRSDVSVTRCISWALRRLIKLHEVPDLTACRVTVPVW